VTDAAINIAPTLNEKCDIVQNAIDLAHALTNAEVKVAILSAMETVNADVPSMVKVVALCKMADRGRITGAVLDGPPRSGQRHRLWRCQDQEHKFPAPIF